MLKLCFDSFSLLNLQNKITKYKNQEMVMASDIFWVLAWFNMITASTSLIMISQAGAAIY